MPKDKGFYNVNKPQRNRKENPVIKQLADMPKKIKTATKIGKTKKTGVYLKKQQITLVNNWVYSGCLVFKRDRI